jgi:hypothetical protein
MLVSVKKNNRLVRLLLFPRTSRHALPAMLTCAMSHQPYRSRRVFRVPFAGVSISKRAKRVLESLGVTSWHELSDHSAVDVLRIPHCGPQTFAEIQLALQSQALCFQPRCQL